MNIYGIDPGNGNIKVSAPSRDEFVIPAALGDTQDLHTQSLHAAAGVSAIRENGRTWFFGDTALQQSRTVLLPHGKHRDDAALLTLLRASLATAGASGAIQVVSGLAHRWMAQRADYAAKLAGPHAFECNGKPCAFNIDVLGVISQHAGIFYDQVLQDGGYLPQGGGLRGTVGVLDIGAETAGAVTFRGLQYLHGQSDSVDVGMYAVVAELTRLAERAHQLDMTEREALRTLERGKLDLLGAEVDAHDMIKDATKPLWQQVHQLITSLWKNPRGMEAVLVGGRGGYMFVDKVKAAGFANVRLVDFAQTANARGMRRYGEFLARQRGV